MISSFLFIIHHEPWKVKARVGEWQILLCDLHNSDMQVKRLAVEQLRSIHSTNAHITVRNRSISLNFCFWQKLHFMNDAFSRLSLVIENILRAWRDECSILLYLHCICLPFESFQANLILCFSLFQIMLSTLRQ